VARQRQKQYTFAELNILLATVAKHGTDKPVTRWSAHKAMVQAYTTAIRVGEFIGMWAIAKHKLGGEVTTETVAEFWGLNERTAYRRLEEFRHTWGPPGLTRSMDTPDEVADMLIANYRRRKERLERRMLERLAGDEFELPPGLLAAR
jgi:hypothetical protein